MRSARAGYSKSLTGFRRSRLILERSGRGVMLRRRRKYRDEDPTDNEGDYAHKADINLDRADISE